MIAGPKWLVCLGGCLPPDVTHSDRGCQGCDTSAVSLDNRPAPTYGSRPSASCTRHDRIKGAHRAPRAWRRPQACGGSRTPGGRRDVPAGPITTPGEPDEQAATAGSGTPAGGTVPVAAAQQRGGQPRRQVSELGHRPGKGQAHQLYAVSID